MLEITNINFKLKTVDNLKCSGNVKDIQMSLIKNTFCVNVIYNEGETITTEYTKPKEQDTIEEVNMNLFDKETEDNQQEQVNVSCEVEEQQEEVKEERKEEETEEQEGEEEGEEEEEEETEEEEEEEETEEERIRNYKIYQALIYKEERKETKRKEPEPEEVKEEEPEEEPEVKEESEQQEQPKDKSLSIEELKELLTEKLEKKIPLLVITEY